MIRLTIFSSLVILFAACNSTSQQNENVDNDSIKKNEITTEWQVLFDRNNTDAWRSFKEEELKGWELSDGNLVALGKGGDLGGDIITKEQFEDFELELEWAISKGGNSGIFFHVLEKNYTSVYHTGPEYQLIDDIDFPEKLEEWQLTGANYAMHVAADNKKLKPVGEFNQSRIKVKDGMVEHWLNGEKVVAYELWTDEWYRLSREGKWKDYPSYGLARKGYISLQDHGSVTRFRNIKIKDLTEIGNSIFNGKDLSGWKIYGTEKWYVENSELVCESGPDKEYGYLATEKTYKDFILRLKFKQEADGNSGVFIRSSIEGTKVSGWQVEVAPKDHDTGGIYESYGRGWLYQIPDNKEHILIENDWNTMVIKVQGKRVMVWLNNELMTDLKDDKIGAATGSVALQIHDGGGIKVRWKDLYIREL